MSKNNIKIDGRVISRESSPYVIAEMSANHNGSFERALDIISSAKNMGADAIKLQTYTADSLTLDCNREDFKISGGLWDGYNLHQLYDEAKTPIEWHKDLFDYAKKIGISCFSSPFDESAVDLLEDLNTPAYKIASFEIVDLPLIAYVAQTKKPMILSTGMANGDEILEAVNTAHENGCNDLILLHCISGYPTPVDQSNIKTIPDLAQKFGLQVGLSDHTMGTAVAVASVALGAVVIEKHFTLSRKDKGPDSEFSLEPDELKLLCDDVKNAWLALGEAGYNRRAVEENNAKFRRSIYVVKDIKKGEKFTHKNIRSIRPGYGLPPKYYNELLGKVASSDLQRGSPIRWDDVE